MVDPLIEGSFIEIIGIHDLSDHLPEDEVKIIPEHYAIAFDLHSAVPVQLKPSGGGLPGRRS